jgi:hypothetical protein
MTSVRLSKQRSVEGTAYVIFFPDVVAPQLWGRVLPSCRGDAATVNTVGA